MFFVFFYYMKRVYRNIKWSSQHLSYDWYQWAISALTSLFSRLQMLALSEPPCIQTLRSNIYTKTLVNSQLQNEHHFSLALKNIFENHNIWMLYSLENLHLPLHNGPVQAQTAAHILANLQEFACPKSPRGPVTNLSNLTKVPTGWGKDIL